MKTILSFSLSKHSLILCVVLFSNLLVAQTDIKIKEHVEITPRASTSDVNSVQSMNYPCDQFQYIWYFNWYTPYDNPYDPNGSLEQLETAKRPLVFPEWVDVVPDIYLSDAFLNGCFDYDVWGSILATQYQVLAGAELGNWIVRDRWFNDPSRSGQRLGVSFSMGIDEFQRGDVECHLDRLKALTTGGTVTLQVKDAFSGHAAQVSFQVNPTPSEMCSYSHLGDCSSTSDNISMYYGGACGLDPKIRRIADKGAVYGLNYNDYFKYNVRIVKGDTLGWLGSAYTLNGLEGTSTASGDSILNRDLRLGGLQFYAREEEVKSPTTVSLAFDPQVQGIGSGTLNIQVLPSPLIIKVTPSVLQFGDTAVIEVRLKTSPTDTIGVELPPAADRELTIFQGDGAGFLFSDEDPSVQTHDLVTWSPDTVRFIAQEISPQSDEVEVKIAVSYYDVGAPNYYDYCPPYAGVGKVTINKGNSILLGETKYYYTTVENGALKIQETTDWTKLPANGSSGVTFDDPVAATGSEKNPVYWEDQRPTYDGNTFTGSATLPAGTIRLVGRYWEAGKTFKTTLTARSTDGKSASIDIEVKKPRTLLTQGQSPEYDIAFNVFNQRISIDSLCIMWGGQYGIPPQFLKGEIFQESYKEEDNRFWPTYRYESWQDLRFRKGRYATDYMSQPFWVQENGMGDGNAVTTTHVNVRPVLSFSSINSYPLSPLKIGNYVSLNYTQYYRGADLSKNFSVLGAPSSVQDNWNHLVFKYRILLQKPSTEAVALADRDMKEFFTDNYQDWAQTRKATSYGFFQVLYTTAILTYCGYPNDNNHAPEGVSIDSVQFEIACKLVVHNIKAILKSSRSLFGGGQWTYGFEESYRKGYYRYNQNESYGFDILKNARSFQPNH
jgi:hypothetical protein